jgi:hypothetical protein
MSSNDLSGIVFVCSAPTFLSEPLEFFGVLNDRGVLNCTLFLRELDQVRAVEFYLKLELDEQQTALHSHARRPKAVLSLSMRPKAVLSLALLSLAGSLLCSPVVAPKVPSASRSEAIPVTPYVRPPISIHKSLRLRAAMGYTSTAQLQQRKQQRRHQRLVHLATLTSPLVVLNVYNESLPRPLGLSWGQALQLMSDNPGNMV